MNEAEERLMELAYEAGQHNLPLDELKQTLKTPEKEQGSGETA